MIPLQLSQVTPDFDSLVLQLQLYLNQKATWTDFLTSSTGQAIVELDAAVGAFNQYAIESAYREAFLPTALRDSSIYAITRMLGVRITRKVPASVTVSLSRADTSTQQVLSKYTQFDIQGTKFFNRAIIVFPVNIATMDVTLCEGEIRTQTFAADTTVFRELYLDEPNFVVSDLDVRIRLINNSTKMNDEWSKVASGNAIWVSSFGEKVYYDCTSGLGDTIISFGDGDHGAIPPLGSDITIDYAVTQGSLGNNGLTGLAVKCISDTSIVGTTSSIISGGADEKPAAFYRAMAPYIFRARDRAVNAADYRALAVAYGGIASASIIAQRNAQTRIRNPQWMNVVQICLLPTKPDPASLIKASDDYVVSDATWTDFKGRYMENLKHVAIWIDRIDPYKHLVNVEVTLALDVTATPSTVIPLVDTAIRALFSRQYNTLGQRIAISDIVGASLVRGVDYVDVKALMFSTDSVVSANDLVPSNPTPGIDGEAYVRQMTAFLELAPDGLKINTKYSERK